MIIQSKLKLLNKFNKKYSWGGGGFTLTPKMGLLQVSREFEMNSYIVEIIFEGHKNDKRIVRLRPLFWIGAPYKCFKHIICLSFFIYLNI